MIIQRGFNSNNKYGNVRTTVKGINFHSKKEAVYYSQLLLEEKAGKISDLILQQSFPIKVAGKNIKIRSKAYPNGRSISYRADFSFFDNKTGKTRIIDVKGYDTPISRIKRALVEAIYGIEVEIV